MYEEYENEFLLSVKLPNGKVIYRLEEDEIEEVKAAIERKKPIPPPKYRRMLPFGQGVKAVGDHFVCCFGNTQLGIYPTLREALAEWDQVERYERCSIKETKEQDEIDNRYYADLTYDEDGYKVFKSRPLIQ